MKRPTLDKTKLGELCQKYDIDFLALFGSHARGNATKKSDVDLLVQFSKQKGLIDIVRIERNFSEALGRKVDLITRNSISPYLKDRVISEMKVLYG